MSHACRAKQYSNKCSEIVRTAKKRPATPKQPPNTPQQPPKDPKRTFHWLASWYLCPAQRNSSLLLLRRQMFQSRLTGAQGGLKVADLSVRSVRIFCLRPKRHLHSVCHTPCTLYTHCPLYTPCTQYTPRALYTHCPLYTPCTQYSWMSILSCPHLSVASGSRS